ncbi:MAG: pectinesterase family protein [Clostridia bacterium]|nr:pectinesterase family protein [Clostridia bacterium]
MHILTLTPGASIGAALNALPPEGDATLRLPAGVFREKVELTRPHTRLLGVSPEKTRIVFGDCANAIHADGQPYNTFRTATLRVLADNVCLENLCVENDAADPARNGQCVALYVYGDRFAARNCHFLSTQDTLFCGPLPDDLILRYDGFLPDAARYREGSLSQHYEDCVIAGSVDFIFGCADALFSRCTLRSVFDGRDGGFVAAPAHSLKQTRGFVFADCDFTGEGVSQGSVFLARPWRDFGKASFLSCCLGAHIAPALFDPWNDTRRDRTARFGYFDLGGSRIAPVCWGRALTQEEAGVTLSRAAYINPS